MSNEIKVSKDPDANWANDHLQFARLIAEMQALDFIGGNELSELATEMDLDRLQVEEIIDRACDAYDTVKEKL